MAPSDITDAVAASYVDHRRKQSTRHGRAPSDGTIRREVGTLRTALNWAARNKVILAKIDIRMPVAEPPSKDRWLSHSEATAIIKAAEPHIALYIRIALATAARRAAILELEWDRVDLPPPGEALGWTRSRDLEFEYETLELPVYLDMGRGRGNKRRARVPLGDNAPLYRALLAAKKKAKSAFVIEYRGRRVLNIRTGLTRACERAGVEVISPHVLKHTAISWMVQAGVSYDDVSALVGTSADILRKVYGHLSPDHLRKIGLAVTV
jgi:integrase